MTMSNIRTFADELRAAVEQAAVKRASERPAKRLRPAPPVANLVAQTLPEQTAPATNLVIRQVANSTDSSGQPEKDTEKAENPTANGETKDLEPNGAKAPKRELVRQTSFEERLDALVNNLDLSEVEIEDTPLPPEEQSRKDFADRLDRNLDEDKLVGMLEELKTKAPSWGALRRMRSIGLLVVHVSRSSRVCRGAFVAKGLPLLGELLTAGVETLEEGPDSERHEASMRSMACLACLLNLSVGRAIMWEHRQTLGKAFDRLHRWCGREKTARAAELRAPCTALSRRWRQQAKPASSDTPQNKALRVKVLEMVKQGLEGADAETLKKSLPLSMVASEIEATLYAFHKGATADYRHHARMLRKNMVLVGNESLRERILSGEIGAQELVNMDSRSLAPQTLQEQRKAAELEALKSVVLQADAVKQMETPLPSFDWRDETWRDETYPSSVKEVAEEAKTFSANSAEKVSENLSSEAASPTPLSEGPNTPIVRTTSYGAPSTPEAMATPAPDDEDEQAEDLIRYFSQSVRD